MKGVVGGMLVDLISAFLSSLFPAVTEVEV
jgi:hypothetical protein